MQAARTREELKGRWIDARTIEVLHRGWHIDGQAVRPDHRMVAHTAFLTVARFLGAGNRAMRADPKVERVR
jgi:tRNA (adenine57-N1/adenine58-N1)-methyltransferase